MHKLGLHEFHARLKAQFCDVNGEEAVAHYGDSLAEHTALRRTAGVLDLSVRGRLCLTGADRQRFLNGQVTNNVKDLMTGQGCYAALVTAKGKLESDLNIYCLENELLLDFEPGLTARIAERFEKYIIADDVQVVDVGTDYGLLSIQGPSAETVVRQLEIGLSPNVFSLPGRAGAIVGAAPRTEAGRAPWLVESLRDQPMNLLSAKSAGHGETYLMCHPRTGGAGFDLFVPTADQDAALEKLNAAVESVGGRLCGWQALEIARIEAGIPRFGVDMDESNLAPEAGIESRAISYTKGCYIGQEVIARIRTYGQVARTLRGLRLADDLKRLPGHGDKLFKDEKEVGWVTSATASPAFNANLGLGYVRREADRVGGELRLRLAEGESNVSIVELPFHKAFSRPS
jgi:folate-binding protein YgfZ